MYQEGVLKSNSCGQESNHSVLAVGFGWNFGHEYVLVKNSWGSKWGVDGYAQILLSDDNVCGILNNPMYPE